jgi:hypothetical protein
MPDRERHQGGREAEQIWARGDHAGDGYGAADAKQRHEG